MAYWWVAHNHSYKRAMSGGYLWCPLPDSYGNPFHWANMRRVQPGDVILTYVKKQIYSIAIAKTSAYEGTRQQPTDTTGLYGEIGLRVDVSFQQPPNQVNVPDFTEELLSILPDTYSPLTSSGTGNQGYLFSLPARAAQLLLSAAGVEDKSDHQNPIVEGISKSNNAPTVREALILSRVGQGQFRHDVLNIWSAKCCITGLSIERLLRASHIKPWRDSNNRERLDPYNGLLLSPSYDAAFDQGYISFGNNGHILVSNQMKHEQMNQLGIGANVSILHLKEEHKKYLAYHQKEIYRN